MYKTFYISMDQGRTFKRFTRDEGHFSQHMWTTLTRALCPSRKWSAYGECLEIHILEPKCMREIHTFYLNKDTSLEDLWKCIKEMWRAIECFC